MDWLLHFQQQQTRRYHHGFHCLHHRHLRHQQPIVVKLVVAALLLLLLLLLLLDCTSGNMFRTNPFVIQKRIPSVCANPYYIIKSVGNKVYRHSMSTTTNNSHRKITVAFTQLRQQCQQHYLLYNMYSRGMISPSSIIQPIRKQHRQQHSHQNRNHHYGRSRQLLFLTAATTLVATSTTATMFSSPSSSSPAAFSSSSSSTTSSRLQHQQPQIQQQQRDRFGSSTPRPTFCQSVTDPNTNIETINATTKSDMLQSAIIETNTNQVIKQSKQTLHQPVSSSSPSSVLYFSPNCLDYDHYNGVTIDLDRDIDDDDNDITVSTIMTTMSFEERLTKQLQIWKEEGIIRGVWIHISGQRAEDIPTCVKNGFDFHMVSPTTSNEDVMNKSNNVLILSQWLPQTPSRLPNGPTHQVGVGCVLWHPNDIPGPNRRLLVVQEKSGPAATFQLWKLPTGLADPNEDIHRAAIREFLEETGIEVDFDGLLLVRQAHPNESITTVPKRDDRIDKRKPRSSSVQRKTSDLFFVCQMSLPSPLAAVTDSNTVTNQPLDTDVNWIACPNEIAAIQWMSVQEYCNQKRWQSSPLYVELNRVISESALLPVSSIDSGATIGASNSELWKDTTLPVWLEASTTSAYTNTFYSVKKQDETKKNV